MYPIVKIYLQQVKDTFPVLGKPERQYLKKLQSCVQSYVEDRPDLTLNDLIEQFGPAEDVFALYVSGCATESLVHRMQIEHWRYLGVTLLMIAMFALLMIVFIYLYRNFHVFTEEAIARMNDCIT